MSSSSHAVCVVIFESMGQRRISFFGATLFLSSLCLSASQGLFQDRLGERGQSRQGKDKCQIEIFTRGSCIINNNPLKPQVILTFGQKGPIAPDPQRWPVNKPLASHQDVNFNKVDYLSADPKLKQHIAEEFVVRFIELMKREYGKYLQPLAIEEVQFVKLKHWGDANIYDLRIHGLTDLKPIETKLLMEPTPSSTWRFTSTLHITNLTAQFKVDATINNKIVIKNWNLMLLMERCLLHSGFEVDFDAQLLKITSMYIKSFDNFQLVSETLSWPFNEIVSSIVSQEKYYIRNVIELNAQKYINMTLNRHLDLNAIMEKIISLRV